MQIRNATKQRWVRRSAALMPLQCGQRFGVRCRLVVRTVKRRERRAPPARGHDSYCMDSAKWCPVSIIVDSSDCNRGSIYRCFGEAWFRCRASRALCRRASPAYKVWTGIPPRHPARRGGRWRRPCIRREENFKSGIMGVQPFRQHFAAHQWHDDIGDHQANRRSFMLPNHPYRVLAVRGQQHFITQGFEYAAGEKLHRRLVFHDQQSF